MGNYIQQADHIKSQTRSLIGFFEENNIYIPKYQRKYEWADEQWQEFINTIFSEEAFDDKYMGSLILCSSNETHNLNVVDGQQRLVTLFIFLLFIFMKFENNVELRTSRNIDFLNFIAMFNNKINNF